jgi:hypothetical protein
VTAKPVRGGVLLLVDGALFFVPASLAVRIAPWPRVTPVPGAPPGLLGMAMHEGIVVPVLSIGEARGEMVVVQYAGELVGLVGAQVVRSGTFPVVSDRADAIEHEGSPVRPLDVAAVYARVQSGARAGPWG